MAGKMDDAFVQAVTQFLFVEDPPALADVIFIPGSHQKEHVLRAAALYQQGFAPWILPSGKCSIACMPLAPDTPTEWEKMRQILLANGVPDKTILRESQATYTWENAKYSRLLTDARGMTVRRAILCCKSYHARRALFYYQLAFPEAKILVCPAEVPGLGKDDWWKTTHGREEILGEVRRLGDQVKDLFEEKMAALTDEEGTVLGHA